MIRPSFHEQAENRRLNHMINTMINHENRILTMINHSPSEKPEDIDRKSHHTLTREPGVTTMKKKPRKKECNKAPPQILANLTA